MARYRISKKKNLNVGRIAAKIGGTVLALWVGGFLIQEIGGAARYHCSPFFEGLNLIGWEVGNNATAYTANTTQDLCPGNSSAEVALCTGNNFGCNDQANSEFILYDTSESGILSVVGIIGVAAIVMEFVEFKVK